MSFVFRNFAKQKFDDPKMRKSLIIIIAGLFAIVACTSKTTEYAAADGKIKAVHDERNDSWVITDETGMEPVQDYDSMRVVELGEDGHPKTVCYYKAGHQT